MGRKGMVPSPRQNLIASVPGKARRAAKDDPEGPKERSQKQLGHLGTPTPELSNESALGWGRGWGGKSGCSPLTCPAWVTLPVTERLPAGIAQRFLAARKPPGTTTRNTVEEDTT
ncbi:hypothetical protein ABEB36_015825 [Hypothenemus hampei]|uniref:Uncharacterized protein n=1 Tax=Hypothenemus hampei TaxID=57062 RepID=A0ABD1DYT7_HYPHA